MRVSVMGVAATCAALCGCSQIFGLEAPQRATGDANELRDGDGDGDVLDDVRPDDAAVDGAVDAASLNCPSTYTPVGNSVSRYRLVSQNTEWPLAADDCGNDGATTHLLVLSDMTELNGLAVFGGGVKWIGLSDNKTEGTFIPVTAENTLGYPPATGGPWAAFEPSSEGLNVDCVYVDGTGNLHAEPCTLNRNYVCECDAYANDPLSYK